MGGHRGLTNPGGLRGARKRPLPPPITCTTMMQVRVCFSPCTCLYIIMPATLAEMTRVCTALCVTCLLEAKLDQCPAQVNILDFVFAVSKHMCCMPSPIVIYSVMMSAILHEHSARTETSTANLPAQALCIDAMAACRFTHKHRLSPVQTGQWSLTHYYCMNALTSTGFRTCRLGCV